MVPVEILINTCAYGYVARPKTLKLKETTQMHLVCETYKLYLTDQLPLICHSNVFKVYIFLETDALISDSDKADDPDILE